VVITTPSAVTRIRRRRLYWDSNMQDKSERRASVVWRNGRNEAATLYASRLNANGLLYWESTEPGKVIIATIAYGITTETSGTHYSCFIYTSLSISA